MKLVIPQEAVTCNSAVLCWDRIEGASTYRILLDGKTRAEVPVTDAKLTGLLEKTRYLVLVQALDQNGRILVRSAEEAVTTKSPGETVSAADVCLVRDRKDPEAVKSNTAALQRAIDACPENGTLVVPAGTYVSGALFLHGDMTLHLERDAVLKASDDPADFPPARYRYEGVEQNNFTCLLNTRPGEKQKNLAITGEGTIDANGAVLFEKELNAPEANRANAVCIQNTDGLYLDGITVREAPFWCLHPIFCRHVTMYGITIDTGTDKSGSPYGLFNGDGIDPDSCFDVRILHSSITSQDDCIALKAGRYAAGRKDAVPTEHVRISNCRFFLGFGVAIGSESSAGIRDVLVQDCTFTDSFSIATVKNRRGKAGYIEDITYDHCTLTDRNPKVKECIWFRGAINIDQSYGEENFDRVHPAKITADTPYIGNITIANLFCSSPYGKPIYICGLPEQHIRHVTLKNIVAEGADGCIIANADDVCMENVSVRLIGDEAL